MLLILLMTILLNENNIIIVQPNIYFMSTCKSRIQDFSNDGAQPGTGSQKQNHEILKYQAIK